MSYNTIINNTDRTVEMKRRYTMSATKELRESSGLTERETGIRDYFINHPEHGGQALSLRLEDVQHHALLELERLRGQASQRGGLYPRPQYGADGERKKYGQKGAEKGLRRRISLYL